MGREQAEGAAELAPAYESAPRVLRVRRAGARARRPYEPSMAVMTHAFPRLCHPRVVDIILSPPSLVGQQIRSMAGTATTKRLAIGRQAGFLLRADEAGRVGRPAGRAVGARGGPDRAALGQPVGGDARVQAHQPDERPAPDGPEPEATV